MVPERPVVAPDEEEADERADEGQDAGEHEHEPVAGDVRVAEVTEDVTEEPRRADLLEPLLLGPHHELGGAVVLRRGRVDAALHQQVEEAAEVVLEEQRGHQRDADGAAELLRGVDHTRGLAADVLRDGVDAGRVVHGEDDPETDALEHESGHQAAATFSCPKPMPRATKPEAASTRKPTTSGADRRTGRTSARRAAPRR